MQAGSGAPRRPAARPRSPCGRRRGLLSPARRCRRSGRPAPGAGSARPLTSSASRVGGRGDRLVRQLNTQGALLVVADIGTVVPGVQADDHSSSLSASRRVALDSAAAVTRSGAGHIRGPVFPATPIPRPSDTLRVSPTRTVRTGRSPPARCRRGTASSGPSCVS